MKHKFLSVFLLAFVFVICANAADYASISGEPLSSLNQQTNVVVFKCNAVNAKINGKTYDNYLKSLDNKQKAKYDKDIEKLKKYIIKRFNKTNKKGFQLTEHSADYLPADGQVTADINITSLSFADKKGRAKISATIDIRKQGSQQTVTQIRLTNFEGAKKSGMSSQLQQLAKDIIEYIAIYL